MHFFAEDDGNFIDCEDPGREDRWCGRQEAAGKILQKMYICNNVTHVTNGRG